jgi:hypothetical protein
MNQHFLFSIISKSISMSLFRWARFTFFWLCFSIHCVFRYFDDTFRPSINDGVQIIYCLENAWFKFQIHVLVALPRAPSQVTNFQITSTQLAFCRRTTGTWEPTSRSASQSASKSAHPASQTAKVRPMADRWLGISIDNNIAAIQPVFIKSYLLLASHLNFCALVFTIWPRNLPFDYLNALVSFFFLAVNLAGLGKRPWKQHASKPRSEMLHNPYQRRERCLEWN